MTLFLYNITAPAHTTHKRLLLASQYQATIPVFLQAQQKTLYCNLQRSQTLSKWENVLPIFFNTPHKSRTRKTRNTREISTFVNQKSLIFLARHVCFTAKYIIFARSMVCAEAVSFANSDKQNEINTNQITLKFNKLLIY